MSEQESAAQAGDMLQVQQLISEFAEAGEQASPEDQNYDWMLAPLSKHLQHSQEEIKSLRDDIVRNISCQEQSRASLARAKSFGLSRESWLTDDIKKSTSHMSQAQMGKYFQDVDNAIKQGNDLLEDIVRTKTGDISNNPNLDGNLAEGYHASTFNVDAAARQSEYHAEVPQGNSKNSVDILVKDSSGKVEQRYQAKYYENAEKTGAAFKHGDYRGQQKLVPADQQDQIAAKTADRIKTADGTQSKTLTKEEAKALQNEAQESKSAPKLDWDDVSLSSVAKSIATQSVKAGVMGGVITSAVMVGSDLLNGKDIDGKAIAQKAIVAGSGTAAKTAATGAVVVAMEKGIVPGIKVVANEAVKDSVRTVMGNTLSHTLTSAQAVSVAAGAVSLGIDAAKSAYDVYKGNISVGEAIDIMEDSSAATVAGTVAAAKGYAIGGALANAAAVALGATLGPVGMAIAGGVGAMVGGMAGSAVGRAVSQGARAVRKAVVSVAKSVVSTTVSVVKSVGSAISSGISSICSFLGF